MSPTLIGLASAAATTDTPRERTKKCGVETQVWSRVCGYFSPVNTNWNRGKLAEWRERKPYVLDYKVVTQN